jgi:hypothetical protein
MQRVINETVDTGHGCYLGIRSELFERRPASETRRLDFLFRSKDLDPVGWQFYPRRKEPAPDAPILSTVSMATRSFTAINIMRR